METLLHSCANVCEPIELSFRVLNGVDLGTCVLDGRPGAPRGRAVLGDFCPVGLNGTEMYLTCV